uniref:Uncharacterized protein n=1 Tax=Melanopsichium pennsylvanicum 4 TaxID=1398559 RepID=A0A077QZX6_9BASI|nr:conserved hypothetical protein [Melanopsichium pennsylvanicum 4]
MEDQRSVASQETMDSLSREQLRACVELIESGVNAEAVAAIIENLRKEAAKR